jgi:DNA-directed RNA polymerase subunit M
MDFCPKCESRLKKNSDGLLSCPKCKFVKAGAVKEEEKKLDETNSEFLVMDESDLSKAKGLESTVPIDCEKCHNKEGVSWTFQTRSADEPETKFYRCTKCNYTWRDYT